LFLDAQRAAELAPRVGAVLAEETGVDPQVECFQALARQYRTLPT
jgi:glycerol-3-phosphate dehydrogenase